jgi:hypothetical protein
MNVTNKAVSRISVSFRAMTYPLALLLLAGVIDERGRASLFENP